ncbi:MAG: TIGR03960 family B12-binding radical SAM protein [Armatimonadetes bacterium]|nr:TIGR03960 family B12-binding radical SAM protein [Armatimonadota bacterium]
MDFRLTGIRDQVESILPRVSKPARYTGGELGEVKKDRSMVDVLFALAFPDVYEVGMSNLGLKILYHTLNRRDDTAAERVFAPAADMENELRVARIPLYALESFAPVRDFDIIGFSLAYELTYTNVINMLDLAGIPIRSDNRDESHPLVIAGGHCTVNPEPMAMFIDAFVIGDGEEVVHRIVDVYKDHTADRRELLRALARTEGVYVPSFYRSTGKTLEPVEDDIPQNVSRTVVTDFETADYPDSVVVPFLETIHDRAAVEIMRGCTRTCRFCQAGMITRPVRERSPARLEEQAETLISSTGYDEVGLMSLSSADYSEIGRLVHDLVQKHEGDRVGVSLPSIRADAGCVQFAAEIQRVRKTGLTFAPEAGTQRLRDAINKNVTEGDLLEAVDEALRCGWRKIKLYFVIGLPTETDEDVIAIAGLVHKVLELARARKRPLKINVGVSSFVPKPHTPFQWRAQDRIDELDRKIGLLKTRLRGRAVSLSWHDTEMSELEAVLARAGREIGPAILRAWEIGAKFDGWDDQFDAERWRAAFRETQVGTDSIAHRRIGYDEPLPWDHIDCGVTKRWLSIQDRLADRSKENIDCRYGTCLNCGIKEFLAGKVDDPCPLNLQEPVETFQGDREAVEEARKTAPVEDSPHPVERVWYRLRYAKDRSLRWLSHMDVVRTFERAVRRSRLPVAYSEGFNPRPRMSFYSQLSVGTTGEAEPMTIELNSRVDTDELVRALNSALPDGLVIRAAEEVDGRRSPDIRGSEYLIGVCGTSESDLHTAARELLSKATVVVERKKENGSKSIDIRPGIESVETLFRADQEDEAPLIRARLANVRPSELVDALRCTAPGLELRFAHRVKVY